MPPIPANGILAATVPGVFDGLMLALEKYGTMSFAQVSAPALGYTRGFPTTGNSLELHRKHAAVSAALAGFAEILRATPAGSASRANLLRTAADPYSGRTCRRAKRRRMAIARRRSRRSAIISTAARSRRRSAISRRRTAACSATKIWPAFHAEIDTPRTTTYRGYTIEKPGFWTQGPVMLEALNILEGYDLKAMGHNSPAVSAHRGRGGETRIRRPRPLLRRSEVLEDPRGNAALERLRGRAPQADRSRARFAWKAARAHSAAAADAAFRHGDLGSRGHDLCRCGRRAGQRVLRDAERRVAAFGDRGRYRHSAGDPAAIIAGEFSRPSQFAGGGQAAARDTEPYASF